MSTLSLQSLTRKVATRCRIQAPYAGLWLGEAAQQLAWQSDFEVRNSKREVSRLHKQLDTLERRHKESLKCAAAAAERYRRECGLLHLTGGDLEAELRALVAGLPRRVQPCVDMLQRRGPLRSSVEAYAAMAHVQYGNDPEGALPAAHAVLGGVLQPQAAPALELRPAEAAAAQGPACRPEAGAVLDLDCAAGSFSGDEDVPEPGAREAASDASDRASDSVDWGIALEAGDSGSGAAGGAAGGGIGAGGAPEPRPSAAEDASGARAPQAAGCEPQAGPAAQQLAFNGAFRARLVADLHELHAFAARSGEEARSAFAGLAESVQQQDLRLSDVCWGDARCEIEGLLGVLQDPGLQTVLRVVASSTFAARMLSELTVSQQQVRCASRPPACRGQERHCACTHAVDERCGSAPLHPAARPTHGLRAAGAKVPRRGRCRGMQASRGAAEARGRVRGAPGDCSAGGQGVPSAGGRPGCQGGPPSRAAWRAYGHRSLGGVTLGTPFVLFPGPAVCFSHGAVRCLVLKLQGGMAMPVLSARIGVPCVVCEGCLCGCALARSSCAVC